MAELTPEGLAPQPYHSHAAAVALLTENGLDPSEVLVDGITDEGYQRWLGVGGQAFPRGEDGLPVISEFTPWPEDKREAIVSGLKALGEM